jgi:MFS transporter, DHA3 family, macrolide efflux protein
MVSIFGSGVYLVAIVLFIRNLTDNAAALGIFQMVAHLPIILLAPLAGFITERSSKKLIMILTDTFRGLLMIAAALAAGRGRLDYVSLLILTILISVNSAFFLPASHALFPELIPPAAIRRRNSLRSVLLLLANLGGTSLGGAAYARFSISLILFINGITFLASAFQESFIRTVSSPPLPQGIKKISPWKKARLLFHNSMRVLTNREGTSAMLLSHALIHALSPPLILSLPFLLDERYGAGPAAFGISLSMLLAGGGTGALLFGYSPRRPGSSSRIFFSALFMLPVLIIIAGTGKQLPVLYGTLAAAGICIGLLFQIMTSSLYLLVPEGERGTTFALLEAMASFSTPLSYGFSGFLIQIMRARLRWLYLVGGALLAIVTLYLRFSSSLGSLIRNAEEISST